MAFSFDDSIVTEGLKTSLMINAYKKGFLSLGQFTKTLNKTHEEGMFQKL